VAPWKTAVAMIQKKALHTQVKNQSRLTIAGRRPA
jgi:hypothetical protein